VTFIWLIKGSLGRSWQTHFFALKQMHEKWGLHDKVVKEEAFYAADLRCRIPTK